MRTIIRVEHPGDGFGLFTSRENGNPFRRQYSFTNELIYKHSNFPCPRQDTEIRRHAQRNEYCAFKSIEQIQQWIEPEWFKELKQLGFKILALEVSNCTVGEFQILYKKEDIISSNDISDLF